MGVSSGDALEVLYQDSALIAVNKPSGLAAHRGWSQDRETLASRARVQFELEKVHLIHRLDRGTSGVVLIARGVESARALGRLFDERQVFKRYLALTRGVAPSDGTIEHAIPRQEKGERVASTTHFRRAAHAPTSPRHVSLVWAQPETGRLHQVRRHLKHINHPLIGDARYGKGVLNRAFAQGYGLSRLALHAERVMFEHPMSGASIIIRAPLPPDLFQPLLAMGFRAEDWAGDEGLIGPGVAGDDPAVEEPFPAD